MTIKKRVLIADDDENLVDVVARHCERLGLRVERAYDGITALAKIMDLDSDLMVLDVNMPGGSGLSVCEMLARDAHLKSAPVIILTGRKDEATIRSCHDLLAYYVPKGTDMWLHLEPLIVELLGLGKPKREDHQMAISTKAPGDCVRRADGGHASPIDAIFSALGVEDERDDESMNEGPPSVDATAPWVLCVDDDGDFAETLKVRLRRQGVEVLQAFAGMAGYRAAFTSPAQAIILDYQMPDGNGDYILRRLKENIITEDIPVIVLTGTSDRMLERKMYHLGAARFLTKPVEWDDLWGELRKHLTMENHA